MSAHKWIMSEGGPLIAVEQELQASWGGICRLTVPESGAANDYDRPPEILNYIQSIDLQRGQGLIFGEGPLDTTFWRDSAQQFFVVRINYCEADFDLDKMMHSLSQKAFESPDEEMIFMFLSDKVIIFDSADDGSRSDVAYIQADVEPGCYQILTKLHEPDDRTSSIIHRFSKIN